MDPSWEALKRYLDSADDFDEICMSLFQHGVECVGLTPLERWRELLDRARKQSGFLGLDESLHPPDFGALAQYQEDIQKIPLRYPLPGPLSLQQLGEFAAPRTRQEVEWRGLE